MPGRSPLALGRVVERMAKLAPPRHRELVRGMVAELDSIARPAERTRFALGAVVAIARLGLSGRGRATVHALGRLVGVGEPEDGPTPGGPSMPKLTPGRLLRRHVVPFAVSFASLTALLLANFAVARLRHPGATGVPTGTLVEVVLLAVPFTLALTIPMAVFLAVAWAFMRLGAEGVLASAKRERHGVRRLVAPVLGAAAVIAASTFVLDTQVVPRANARLVEVLSGAPAGASDRTMTVGELRRAAREARTGAGADAAVRAAGYEVEIQKRFALATACMLLALAAAAIAIRFPHGGAGLVLVAGALVFTGYGFFLVAGESLAERQVISPVVAMWMANVLLLALGLFLLRRPGRPDGARGAETLAIGG